MPNTVVLPADTTPAFPDRCVVCSRDAPGDAIELRTLYGRMNSAAAIPTCTACKPTLIRSRWISKAIMGAGVLVAALLIYVLAQREWVEGWPVYAAGAAALFGPLVFATLVYTPHFDLRPRTDRRLFYEFRDPDYAKAVAERSGGTLR